MRGGRKLIMICYIKAFIEFIRYGVFIPHVYKEIGTERKDIFVTDNGFRVANNYEHLSGERLIRNVYVSTSVCSCCGKEFKTWQYGDVPVLTDEW